MSFRNKKSFIQKYDVELALDIMLLTGNCIYLNLEVLMNERQIYVETWYLILSGSPDLPNVLNPFQFFFLERYLKNYHWKNVDENLRYYISND